jgi:hypothetical protein
MSLPTGSADIPAGSTLESASEPSPPTLSSSLDRAVPTEVDELYRVTLNALLKPYKNAQARSSASLGVININVSSVEAFKAAVFAAAKPHVVDIAVLGNNGFSMRAGQLSCDDLSLMTSFKNRNHFYTIESQTCPLLISVLCANKIHRYLFISFAKLDRSSSHS